MHALYGAVVAPAAGITLPLLGEICACAFVIGCIWVLRGFVKALFTSLFHVTSIIPWFNHLAEGPLHRAESAVANALGSAEAFFDHRIGSAFHQLARIADWTYREIKDHSAWLYGLAGLALGPSFALEIRTLIRLLRHRTDAQGHSLTETIRRIERAETALKHRLEAGVLPRLGRLEREYDHIIDRDIAGLRARTKSVEGELSKVWDYVRSHPWTIVTDAFVGAVALALARLDLGWLRCPSLTRLGKTLGCKPWQLLEELLAASVTALAVADLCTFANLAMGVATELRPALLVLVDVEDALVGCHGATGAPPLAPNALRLPPNSRNLPLSA